MRLLPECHLVRVLQLDNKIAIVFKKMKSIVLKS